MHVQACIYRIAGNFRGTKYSWLEVWPRIFYPRMKRPCLPLPAVQAATTKILPTKCLNIAEPRIFCPLKITRYIYTVHVYMYMHVCMYCTKMPRNTCHEVVSLTSFFLAGIWRRCSWSTVVCLQRVWRQLPYRYQPTRNETLIQLLFFQSTIFSSYIIILFYIVNS